MNGKNVKILNKTLPILTVVIAVTAWALMAKIIDSEYILPSVKNTAKKFFSLFADKTFYLSFALTLLRSIIAFAVSFSVGFCLAVLSVKSKTVQGVVTPIIAILRALPTIAIVLLLLFWTNSQIAPIIVTLLVVLPTVYTQTASAFSALDKTVLEAGRVDGATEAKVFSSIELPQVLPTVFNIVGSGISLNFKLMVAAEVIGQTANSIGYMLNVSKVYFEIAEMLAIVCVAVIFGVIVEYLFGVLAKKFSDWQ